MASSKTNNNTLVISERFGIFLLEFSDTPACVGLEECCWSRRRPRNTRHWFSTERDRWKCHGWELRKSWLLRLASACQRPNKLFHIWNTVSENRHQAHAHTRSFSVRGKHAIKFKLSFVVYTYVSAMSSIKMAILSLASPTSTMEATSLAFFRSLWMRANSTLSLSAIAVTLS